MQELGEITNLVHRCRLRLLTCITMGKENGFLLM